MARLFQGGCPRLHPQQQCMKVLVSLCPCNTYLIMSVLDYNCLRAMRQYLSMILIFISLMPNEEELLFVCLWTLCIYSLEECLLRFFVKFMLGWFSKNHFVRALSIFQIYVCRYFLVLWVVFSLFFFSLSWQCPLNHKSFTL